MAFNEPGQIPGTVTNDNADPGNIGEDLPIVVPPPIAGRVSTVTISIASPAVISWASAPFSTVAPNPVVFTTTGALPTGIIAGTTYWSIPSTVTSSGFEIATSIANAFAGAAVNTSGTQSGTQTATLGAPLTTATSLPVTALLLTAGDWTVQGSGGVYSADGAATITFWEAEAGTTLGSIGGVANITSQVYPSGFAPFGTSPAIILPLVSQRFTVANGTTQIVYLNVQAVFGTSSLYGLGKIEARRVR